MHLVRQNQTWFFRRRVPRDLHSRLGKRELYKSLSTSCRKEARRRAALLFVASDEAFELAKDDDLSPRELAAIARHWFEGQAALRAKIDKLSPGQLAKFQTPEPVRPYKPQRYLHLLEVVTEGRYRYRVFGSIIGRLFDRDLQNREVGALPEPERSEALLDYGHVIRSRAPHFIERERCGLGRRDILPRLQLIGKLCLPLSEDGTAVSQILVGIYPRSD